jgi:hypothetical protein
MSLIVLKSAEFVGQPLSDQVPTYFNYEGLDVITYTNIHTIAPHPHVARNFIKYITECCNGFYYIICDNRAHNYAEIVYARKIFTLASIAQQLTYYVIDAYNRLPLADGAFIHCARDYFDKYNFMHVYDVINNNDHFYPNNSLIMPIGVGSLHDIGEFHGVITDCKLCGKPCNNITIIVRECGHQLCNICTAYGIDKNTKILAYNNCIFDYYVKRSDYSQSEWFIYSQLLAFRDIRLVVTSIDTQVILLIGEQYYITEAPIPPAAISIIGKRKRLRLNHNVYIKKNEDKHYRMLFSDI